MVVKQHIVALLLAGVLLASAAPPAAAQQVGPARSLCSVVHYTACYSDGECFDTPIDPASVPAFITIDRAAGVVHATEPTFNDQNSTILDSAEEDGRIMLTGIQGGRAWGITIIEETGEMSLAISDPDEAILVSGRCVSLDDLDR